MASHTARDALRQKLIKRFTGDEIRGLCFALGINHELPDTIKERNRLLRLS